ncbi:protein Wnt-5b-like [Lethenteron reissneri]|uniref:protein Wnt-5b-like n=1 Tax=Lethenteron reissneri TaxID=7753 RepID=UPI002AB63571|nr:protein Wnt-5b-like [Lethenteron reissneri]
MSRPPSGPHLRLACWGLVLVQLWTVGATSWWSLALRAPDRSESPMIGAQPLCASAPGLSPGQRKLCHLYQDHVAHIGEGARLALRECQHQFRSRRWNCTALGADSVFGPVAQSGNTGKKVEQQLKRGERHTRGITLGGRKGIDAV